MGRDTQWTCHICGENKPDHLISVFSKDTSTDHGLPPGTMKENVRYCNDNPACVKAAPNFSFTKKEVKE
jgi:hypothetical protein